MKQVLLLSGAAMLAFAGAAHAKPPHAHHGKGNAAAAFHGHGAQPGRGLGGCPPGLAKQNPQCMPPGLYKKQFEIGQRVPDGYRGLLGYDALPRNLRDRYGGEIDPYSRYIYDQNYIYRVDPKTMIVREILRALL